MANERLRDAIDSAGVTLEQLSEKVEVDPKTIERWISKGRLPHRVNRQRLAIALGVSEGLIWPGLTSGGSSDGSIRAELVHMFPSRGSIPTGFWTSLIDETQERIAVLAFSASFLHDSLPNFVQRLRDKSEAGVEVRLLLGNPDSEAVAIRGAEEGIAESLRERCRLTWKYLQPLMREEGVELREHETTLYQSMFLFDNDLLVNQHGYGSAASRAPVLHLHVSEDAPMSKFFLDSFDTVWEAGTPPRPW